MACSCCVPSQCGLVLYVVYRRNLTVNLHIVNYVFWEVFMIDIMVESGLKHSEVV